MPRRDDAPRDLLFGLLALQNGMVTRDQLVIAFTVWTAAQEKPLADLLAEQGALRSEHRPLLDALAEAHLKLHGGDPEKSLAALDVNRSTRESLARLGDPDIEETLGYVASAHGSTENGDGDRTTSYAVGESTSDGQRFRILRPHAQGGLGAVFVALDSELHREVALKQILDHHADDPVSRQRFLIEAEITGGLEHPGIVPVYGLGTYAGGRPYYAMRFIRGDSLKEAIEHFHADVFLKNNPGRRSLELRKLLRRFTDICNAIDYAHSRGVLHRDIKPGNVIVGRHGETLVVDWGLAKTLGRVEPDSDAGERRLLPSSASGSAETLPGSALGTPAYMSPEQASGDLDRLGPRSDVYSLGSTLYCLLTGKPPYEGDDIGEVLRKVQRGEFAPPRQLGPSIDKALEAVCLKAMALKSEHRYSSCRALAEDVERWMADEPVSAWAEPWTRKLLRWLTRHRTGVTGAAAVVLAGVVGLAAVLAVQASANARLQTLATKEAAARGEAQANAEKEAKARGEAVRKAEQLALEDYVNRVNRAYREVLDDNIRLAEDLLHGCPPERRGWEWHYVKRLAHLDRLTLEGGSWSVEAIAFSPDGTWLVTGAGSPGYDDTGLQATSIRVWDLATGQMRRSLMGIPKGIVAALAVSPDGTRIATGVGDRVIVSDARSGEVLWSGIEPVAPASRSVMTLGFTPDGRSVVTGYGRYAGSDPGYVKVWDVVTGHESFRLPGPAGGVNKLAIHPDGKRLALAGSEVVELWDLASRTKQRELRGHTRWVFCVAISPDGKQLASGGWDRTIRLWNLESGALEQVLYGHQGFVTGLAFSPDGKHLASSSEDRSVRLWDCATGRHERTVHGHEGFVQVVAFGRGGREFATGSDDGTARIWDLRTCTPVIFDRHRAWVVNLAVRRDGQRVFSMPGQFRTPDDLTRVWDPATGEEDAALAGVTRATLGAGYISGAGTGSGSDADFTNLVATSPDGGLVARAFGPKMRNDPHFGGDSVVVLERTGGRIRFTLVGHSSNILCLLFSPDGRRLATASDDRTIKLWDMTTGREVFTLLGHTGGLRGLAFSPNGHRIISGCVDATARVWDGTPLPEDRIRRDDERYRRKVETLARLEASTDNVQRAESLAADGQWSLAAKAFGKAVEQEPDNLELRRFLLLSLLESGDIPGYRAAAAEVVSRFGMASNPDTLNPVAWLCTYAPDGVADLTVPVQMAEAALAAYPADEKRFALNTLGAALYRAGRIDEAIARLNESVKASGGAGVPQDWVFLAMAHHKKGNGEEARRWLEKVRAHVKDEKIAFSSDLVETRILLKEAEAVLREPPPARR